MTAVRVRLPLVALAMLSLLAGLWAGLIRIGWGLPLLLPSLPVAHGPLMVSGFLGTLIGVERAVALGRPAAYAVPLMSGVGGLVLLLGVAAPAAALLMMLSSSGLAMIVVSVFRREAAFPTAIMGLGAIAWFIGNARWLEGLPIYAAVSWLGGFLVLTIVGERLELSRVARPTPIWRGAFLIALSAYLAGLLFMIPSPPIGGRLEGLGMLGLGLWLLRFDIARHSVRQRGLTRFIAVSLLSGYIWLGAAGILWILFGASIAGPLYDAMLHTLFLGFVFAMIFAHAPIILQAVLGAAVPYGVDSYVPLALLNLSLIVRLCGDLGGFGDIRRWGGLLGAVAVLVFMGNTLRTGLRARRR